MALTDSSAYRRYGAAFTGTRPTLRLGDPGIDDAWLRRYRRSAVAAAAWYVLTPILLAVGFISARGLFGALDSWQLATFGSNNVILLTILFMPLAFAPLIVAHLARIDASRPVLLGIRQSFDANWGPRVVGRSVDRAARLRALGRWARIVAAAGGAVLAFFAWKGVRDAGVPHAPLPELTYTRAVDPRTPLPFALRLVGAVADRSREWAHDYSVRQNVHRDVYYPLRPTGARPDAPAMVLELDETSPQYEAAPWNMVDPPGPREGLPALLDDWTAGQLRHAGIPLATRVIVLKRQQLHGRDPRPDPLDDYLYGMFGFIAMFCGLLFWWALRRAEKQLPVRIEG